MRLRNFLHTITPPRPIRFMLWATAVGVVLFSIVRLIFLLRNLDMLNTGIDNDTSWVLRSLWLGLRFDIDLVTKLMALPLLLLGIGNIALPRYNKWFAISAVTLTALLVSVSIILYIGDVPFFEYSHSHLNALALSYVSTDMGQSIKMVFGDTTYLIFAIASLTTAVLYTLFVVRLARRYRLYEAEQNRRPTAIYVLVLASLLLFTARGLTFRGQPLRYADTVISNNNFINQLCVNPIIPFCETLINYEGNVINFMDKDEAYNYACDFLHRDHTTFTEHNEAKPSPWKHVVVIMQEGNSAERLQREGYTKGLLRNLDRLIEEGLYFENTYSSSSYTCHGIYGVVTSMPPYMGHHPLKDGVQHSLGTIYEQMYRNSNMKTLFFVTHNRDFDNVNGFVTMQGFERLFAEEDYDIKTDKTWGIDDHLLFDRALKEIDAEISNGNNVAAIVLTCSNHRPFNHPDVEGMVYTATDDEEMAIEYADWSMNRFIDMAREKEWFDDTLFVITADHGRSMQEDFVMTESVFHIPLLFYSPKHIAPEIRSDLVAQVDITPTMASMLGVSYDNHTMGIDLNSQSRDYAVITTPTHIGCRSKEWLYAYDINTKVEYLYDLTAEGDACLKNVASEHADIVATMHLHATATIQAGWDMHNAPEQKKSDK